MNTTQLIITTLFFAMIIGCSSSTNNSEMKRQFINDSHKELDKEIREY